MSRVKAFLLRQLHDPLLQHHIEQGAEPGYSNKRVYAPRRVYGYQMRRISNWGLAQKISRQMGWDFHLEEIWRQYTDGGQFYVIFKDGAPFLGIWIGQAGHTEVLPKMNQQDEP